MEPISLEGPVKNIKVVGSEKEMTGNRTEAKTLKTLKDKTRKVEWSGKSVVCRKTIENILFDTNTAMED